MNWNLYVNFAPLFRAFFLLLKGKLKLEGCTRCTRFSIGFDIGPKEVRGYSRTFPFNLEGCTRCTRFSTEFDIGPEEGPGH